MSDFFDIATSRGREPLGRSGAPLESPAKAGVSHRRDSLGFRCQNLEQWLLLTRDVGSPQGFLRGLASKGADTRRQASQRAPPQE